jgi:EpsI family protein
MLLAVPVNFVDTLGFFLRLDVTNWTYAIAQGLGVHLLRNGTQLFSPDGHFQYDVAAACSGIRSLVALLALALLVGYLNFRSWWAWLVLAAAGLPYVVLGNVVRVLAIVLLGEWFGQRAGERLHSWSGALVFMVVVGLLLATLPLLRRVGFKPAEEQGDATDGPDGAMRAGQSSFNIGAFFKKFVVGRDRWARRGIRGELSGPSLPKTREPREEVVRPWFVAASVTIAAAVVCIAVARLDARPAQASAGVRLQADGVSPVKLPESVGTDWFGRSVDVSDVERALLPADTGYSRRNYVSLADLRRQVFVSVVLSGRDRTSIHRPELCLIGQGWSITGRARHEFSAGSESVPVTLLTVEHAVTGAKAANVRSLLAYWFVGGEAVEPTHFGMMARDASDRLRHLRADRWAYVVVQTVIVGGDEAGALARMQEVLAGVWPEIRSKPGAAN